MSAEAEAAVENALEEGNEDAEDEDIEAMKRKVAEIEAEYERLKGQNDEDLDDEGGDATVAGPGGEGKTSAEADPNSADITKSIFIGNLDDSVTPENLQEFFKACGTINRITIMCDKFTGQPKGFAYMEFEETEAVELACGLDETEMNGKPISVKAKRQNVPRFMRGRGRGRGRGGWRGRGRGRGGRGGSRGGYRGRGRGRGRYNPY
mmetsp:Transcript_14536/g.17967  ORF Transcript_14536/g.17967 Transcript_14536/m.17967 type:complete len:207 (-) Transcript_14536:345-965(-)